ncbi:hypothetical protein ACFL04_04705 [Patescibacteria group bacterium]
MGNKAKIIFATIALIIAASYVYWSSIRPSLVRSSCQSEAAAYADNQFESSLNSNGFYQNSEGKWTRDDTWCSIWNEECDTPEAISKYNECKAAMGGRVLWCNECIRRDCLEYETKTIEPSFNDMEAELELRQELENEKYNTCLRERGLR